ncbi:hypothetical protein MKX01_016557 [Papaver californicum]|nr:hypothetical protein MKX01_016557 [Papaver californicum]
MKLVFHVISNQSFSFILLVFIVLNCLEEFSSEAQILPQDEDSILEDISQTSCSRSEDLNATISKNALSKVVCDCSYNSSTICHITNIQLKRLYLSGESPDEFANLSYLQELDFSVNYLNGSISKAWKTLPLVILSLLANNVKGIFPNEIADIVTLEHLVLSENKFTGTLPATFANLKNITDFRIAGTSFSGEIPDFIGNWTQLVRLDMRGTSMEGPIPSTIFYLKNLTTLRVSDLKGPNMPFPDLRDMSSMQQLELRNCLINGSIAPTL